jgi:hypothetical protein
MLTRRRLFLLCLSIVACIFVFRERLSLPSHLQDIDFTLSRANVAYFARNSSPVPEIYGLVHLLTSPVGGQLALNETNSNGELGMQLYSQDANWGRVRSTTDKKWPVIVFSKVRHLSLCSRVLRLIRNPIDILPVCSNYLTCMMKPVTGQFFSYSRRAKTLLQQYDLNPPMKVIEVDLRGTRSIYLQQK